MIFWMQVVGKAFLGIEDFVELVCVGCAHMVCAWTRKVLARIGVKDLVCH